LIKYTPIILVKDIIDNKNDRLINSISNAVIDRPILVIDLCFKPNSNSIYKRYRSDRSINEKVDILNLFDLVTHSKTKLNFTDTINCTTPLVNHSDKELHQRGYTKFPVEGKRNAYRYFENGIYRMYKQFDESGKIAFIDYFAENWKRMRKVYWSEEGQIKKISFMNDQNKVRLETLHTEDFYCYLTLTYKNNEVDGVFYHNNENSTFYSSLIKFATSFISDVYLDRIQTNSIVFTNEVELFNNLNIKQDKKVLHLTELNEDCIRVKKNESSIVLIESESVINSRYDSNGLYRIGQSSKKWRDLLEWVPFVTDENNLMHLEKDNNRGEQDNYRIVSFTMVKNEADIIEIFIRYTLKFVDHMFIAVNLPNDTTKEIIEELIREGLPITIWDDNEPSFEQNKKTTAAYHYIAKNYKFDAILFIDADEFVYGDINEIKNNHRIGNVYQLDRLEYVYLRDVSFDQNVLQEMTLRRQKYQSAKSMICHDSNNYNSYKIGNGSHFVYVNGEQKIDQTLSLKLAHFPIRSIQQFINKSILNWLALMFNTPSLLDAKSTVGIHWREAYKYLVDRDLRLTSDELLSYLYKTSDRVVFESTLINEPIDIQNIKLKYTSLDNQRSLSSMLVKDYENALKKIGELRV